MLRSMFSGVTGLRSHQTMMDVIGNNIANVNTTGYKAGAVLFQDLLSQVLNGAGAPVAGPDGNGGTNPAQVGLGVRVAGIATSFTQGASQLTGRATDLSIQGDGFFVVRSRGEQLYTRAGNFSFDGLGRLVTQDGAVVQGWTADASGAVDSNAAVGDVRLPLGQTVDPQETTTVRIGGNLDAGAAEDTKVTTSISVYDAQGKEVKLSVTYTRTATPDEWTLEAWADVDGDGVQDSLTVSPGTLTFDPSTGELTSAGPFTVDMGTSGTFSGPVNLDFGAPGDPEAVKQFAGTTSVSALSQDGSALGSLQSFSIGPDGTVTGAFSNGRNRILGRIALAGFGNPSGLEKAGSSTYRASVNSGLPQVGPAAAGGRGTIAGSTLEMSNVDLAQEFTNLIVAQRGFQANSRVITASDELLQDLVNLKR